MARFLRVHGFTVELTPASWGSPWDACGVTIAVRRPATVAHLGVLDWRGVALTALLERVRDRAAGSEL